MVMDTVAASVAPLPSSTSKLKASLPKKSASGV
jgi:hypothetical protein